METTQLLKDQAQYLRIGDRLPRTDETVIGVHHQGLDIPAAKVEILLRRPKAGGTKTVRYGKYTEISFERTGA
jgi:hypothetical protein